MKSGKYTKERKEFLLQILKKNKILYIVAAIMILLIHLIPIAEMTILNNFINKFKTMSVYRIIIVIFTLSTLYGIGYLYNPLSAYIQGIMRVVIRERIQEFIAGKLSTTSMRSLEVQENQMLLQRIQEGSEQRIVSAFWGLFSIIGSLFSAIGVFGFVLSADKRYVFVLLGMLFLMIVICFYIGKKRVDFFQTRQESNRRSGYLSNILFERRLAQEKKLFNYTSFIHNLYEEEDHRSVRGLRKSILTVESILWLYENITYLFAASSYLLLLFPLYERKISIGLYVSLMPALTQIGNFAVAVVREHFPAIRQCKACLDDMVKLTFLEEQFYVQMEKKQKMKFRTIEFEDVMFSYPQQQEPVLMNFNLKIESGKSYAIVGENGCGKTTFVKLLLGLYKPIKGKIKIDGRDVQKLTFAQLQEYFSVIFQDFNRYDDSIRCNIGLSDLTRINSKDEIQKAAKGSDIHNYIDSLRGGYETILGTLIEEGQELSLGQWQKIAIGRLLFRKAPIYVWDEPTASMDPVSESRLYTFYQHQMEKENTNIFITHRLGAATMADVIFVIDKGAIVEMGSHVDLIHKKNGIYANMFEAQRGMYQ